MHAILLMYFCPLHSRYEDCKTPKEVKGLLAGEKVVSVQCGADFTLALTVSTWWLPFFLSLEMENHLFTQEDGKVFAWGADDEGQLGQVGKCVVQALCTS